MNRPAPTLPFSRRLSISRFSPLFPLLLCLILALFLGACASLAPRGVVDVSVVDIRPTQAALLETTAALTLRFTNETPAALQLKGSSHRLYLNGSSVGRAVSNETLTIPALSTVTHPVTVHLENLTLVRKATEFSRAPNAIEYRLESQLFTADGPTATGRLRATATGQLDIRGLMDATNRPVRDQTPQSN